MIVLFALVGLALGLQAEPFEYHALLDAHDLFGLAQKSRNAARPASETPCSVFFDQRVGGSKASESPFDTLLEVPLDVSLSGERAYAVHVTVNSRFLASKHAPSALVGSDLVVALSDGQRVLGFVRTTPSATATAWGAALGASYAARALPAASVALSGAIAACDQSAAGCTQRAAENFEVDFVLGARTVVLGRTDSDAGAGNAAGAVEFSDDLRGAAALRLVFYSTAPEHAFELGAVEVRVERVAREQSLAQFASAADFASHTLSERFSSLWTAQALDAAAAGGALFAAERPHALLKNGCGVEFRAAPAVPGVAFANLVALPLVAAGALRRDRQYLIHVAVAADSNTPRNQLLVGVADGVESGAHVVGFARGDRGTAPALGAAFGGLLSRSGAALFVESRQFVALDAGTAGDALARRFEFDVVLGGGATRVTASARDAKASGEAFVDTDRFGVDVGAALYLVALQHADRSSESSTLRLLSVTIDEVRVGCDGAVNSGKQLDACGVCGGDNACVGCDGVPLSGVKLDECGVCGGDSSSCADCNGVPHGTSLVDACGVCGGDNRCLLGSGSAERNAAFRKAQAEKFADADAALLQQHSTKTTIRSNNNNNNNIDNDSHNNNNNNNNNNNHNNNNNDNTIYSEQQQRKRAVEGVLPSVKDAVDCSGRLKREGGKLVYDQCGVCGGDNACLGCDGVPFGKQYDACGKCGGNNSTCCVNYCDVADQYWDFMLLPVTLDNLIEKLELTYNTVAWLNQALPAADRVDAAVATQLQVGRMSEFNRIFLDDCLDVFCAASGELFTKLVADNNPLVVQHLKRTLQLGSL